MYRIHSRSKRTVVPVLMLVLVLLAACGGGGDGDANEGGRSNESQTEGGEGSAMCQAAQRVSDLDAEFRNAMNVELADIISAGQRGEKPSAEDMKRFAETIRSASEESLPDLIAAYDDLEESVPEEYVEEVRALREFTEGLTDELTSLRDEADLQAFLQEMGGPEAAKAGLAAVELNGFTIKECDVSISNG